MPNELISPLAAYNAHLEKGELAYQFSPAANRAVFFPRLLCPYTGSDTLDTDDPPGNQPHAIPDPGGDLVPVQAGASRGGGRQSRFQLHPELQDVRV